jgi:hypothetical protein
MSLTLSELRSRGFSRPVRVVHTLCGAILFFTDGVPRKKEGILNPEKVILINGAHPKAGDPIYCQGCGYGVRKNQMEWVQLDD